MWTSLAAPACRRLRFRSWRSPIAIFIPRPAGVGIGGVSKSLYPYLSKRWVDHVEEFGIQYRQPWEKGSAYPKGQPQACRRDAFLPDGRSPGSDLAFMAQQHLDPNNVALGILNPLTNGQGATNPLLSAAITHATNEWQKAEWTSQDKRLRGSVVVPYEDAAASVKEIELRAGDRDFAQVLLLTRTAEPLGQRRYWPIYEAAAAADLAVGIHAFGNGGWPNTAGGWGSYYIEEMVGHAQAQQALLVSMILEGVFEAIPGLRVVLVEGGLAWAAALGWRMDRQWAKLKRELPHLKRAPSEYIRSRTCGSRRSRSRNRSLAASWPRRSSGSAGTGCCSPPIIRIGILTIPRRRCRSS